MPSRHARSRQTAALLLLAGLLLIAPSGTASDFPDALQTPGKVPERIILGFRGDPARSQAVSWRTRLPVDASRAELAPLVAKADFEDEAMSYPATTEKLDIVGGGVVYHHTVNLTGLTPDTRYSYRVGDGSVWSEWSQLRTAAATAAPFRFLYLGDAQDAIKSLWSRIVRAAYAAAPDARFMLSVGDLTADSWDDARWGELSYALGFISASVPILATPGNHDLHRPPTEPDAETVFSVQPTWRAHLTLPENGPEGAPTLREATWTFDYQGVRFISLEANVYSEEDFSPAYKAQLYDVQPAWLETLLRDNPNRWTIVAMHEPVYTVAKQVDFDELRRVFQPLFDRYGVDLVLAGHNHRYARSHKVRGDRVAGPRSSGTVYTISTSGPKAHPHNPLFGHLMALSVDASQMYQVITVDPQRLLYEARDVTGKLVDAFELRKDRRGASTYVDRAPGALHRPEAKPYRRR